MISVVPSVSSVYMELDGRVPSTAGRTDETTKLESTLKTVINTKLPTCDDKRVFTDDDDTYRKRK